MSDSSLLLWKEESNDSQDMVQLVTSPLNGCSTSFGSFTLSHAIGGELDPVGATEVQVCTLLHICDPV